MIGDGARAETRGGGGVVSRGACRCLGNAASRIQAQPPLSAIFDTAKNVLPPSLSLSLSLSPSLSLCHQVFVFSRTTNAYALMFLAASRKPKLPRSSSFRI